MRWTLVCLRSGAPGAVRSVPLVRLPPAAQIFPLGTAELKAEEALLRFPPGGLTINDGGGEGWAIVGDSEGRRLAVQTLLGRHRITPNSPSPGPLPVLSHEPPHRAIDHDNWKAVRYLAFARPSASGEFTDYTARYGALQEEDKVLLREHMINFFEDKAKAEKNVTAALEHMELNHMRELPVIALSSGQTRRMRIGLGLMTCPDMLVLEDPMAGLDVVSRDVVSGLLADVNAADQKPRIVLVLRDKGDETLADWITDVCEVRNGEVWVGKRDEWEARRAKDSGVAVSEVPKGDTGTDQPPVVSVRNLSVSYGEGTRQVLQNINWTIRPGEKWHLQGANGSGKTTLLSMLLGHHPQTFSLPASALQLFSQPRRLVPTPILRQRIGHTSPEVFAAFPRNMGLNALDAVGTGFEGVFSRRSLSDEQKQRVLYLLDYFKDHLGTSRTGQATDMDARDIARKEFSHFMPPQQVLLIFLRAIVSRAPLVVLDEPTQGMDEKIWVKCRELLAREWAEMRADGRDQAVIVVSHYTDEVPWQDGRVLRLEDGQVAQLE